MVMEAHESDSFLGVVVGTSHTVCMNFISSEPFGCLYPTQTLQNQVSDTFGIPPASTTYFEMLSKGFAIFVDSAYHPVEQTAVMAKWQIATRQWILKTSMK